MVLDRRYGLARGFEVYDDQMGFRRSVQAPSERTADRVVDAALVQPARQLGQVAAVGPQALWLKTEHTCRLY